MSAVSGGAPPPAARIERPAPTIRVRHLSHRFGALDVLRDVTFDVGPGEIFGFIGPNGAGKTTTIRVMATLLEPMAGRVEIDGVDVTLDPAAVRRSIGYMPDHAGVYDRITVREYLEFFADAFRVPSLDVVDAVLELTDLGKIQDRIVATMSKGMKQRLQLGRILLHDPKVLILDEPASDLDPRARIEIRDLLLELRSLGKTIFLSSHILTELSDVCTSIGILEKGRLVVAGPIGEIAARLEALRAAQAHGHAPPRHAAAPGAHPAEARHAPAPGDPAAVGPQQAEGPPPGYGPHPPHAGGPGQAAAYPGLSPLSRRKVKVRVLGDPEAAAYLLRGGPGIADIAIVAGAVHVGYVGNDVKIAEIVQHLVRSGIGVIGVEPERNELERIFLEVTQGEVQ
ncbi:ABC transporter ATP-binding protein [Sorangium cellulosum]|uniref:ABC transporter ATP-binding protein n=2 Tax=Sorangium cellulosum TaxID=56 RepID=S4XK15_SORCE|nr:ABC transporter ATP-binding protein [Sorangium cellulosum]AGP32846.1 ABC transporter ATP-binding protein [Sorangium cellulosum So0157-2]